MDTLLARALATDDPTDARFRVLPQTTPAAATEIDITVPGESIWIPVALTALLTPDNNVTARGVTLQWTDGTNTLATCTAGTTIAASTATTVSFNSDGGTTITTAVGGVLTVNWPKWVLTSGQHLKTVTSGLHANDQWSAIVLTVVELFRGEVAQERHWYEGMIERLDRIADLLNPLGS